MDDSPLTGSLRSPPLPRFPGGKRSGVGYWKTDDQAPFGIILQSSASSSRAASASSRSSDEIWR